ncbi:MAG: hypothetical protein MRJ92_09960 [Nitrospira sp.]|nr:hypothetical protein [Nitrospira sp.]
MDRRWFPTSMPPVTCWAGRPPALASQAMEDGRRAVGQALGLPVGDFG